MRVLLGILMWLVLPLVCLILIAIIKVSLPVDWIVKMAMIFLVCLTGKALYKKMDKIFDSHKKKVVAENDFKCSECGKTVINEDKFCCFCGAKIEKNNREV